MKFDTGLIDMTNINLVTQTDNILYLKIVPIKYNDTRNPRLPRKSSKQTNLQVDTNYVFKHAFGAMSSIANPITRYSVDITIYKGQDRLGGGDLDNYCKAILDAITSTNKVWNDDEQVDEIKIKRFFVPDNHYSFIELTINTMRP